MAGASADSLAEPPLETTYAVTIIQERDVLFPRQTNEHSQLIIQRRIQQPARRHGISAHRIDVIGGHAREVAPDSFRIVVFAAVRFRPEWTVSDPANIKLVFTNEDEFASDVWPGRECISAPQREPRDPRNGRRPGWCERADRVFGGGYIHVRAEFERDKTAQRWLQELDP